MWAHLKEQPHYTKHCPLHPVRVAIGDLTNRESVNLTHNFACNSNVSAHVFFICAPFWSSWASTRPACQLVPRVEALQGGLELVSRGQDALKAQEPQSERQRSVLGHPCDQLVHGSGGGGDLLSAAAVLVFSYKRDGRLQRWSLERA